MGPIARAVSTMGDDWRIFLLYVDERLARAHMGEPNPARADFWRMRAIALNPVGAGYWRTDLPVLGS